MMLTALSSRAQVTPPRKLFGGEAGDVKSSVVDFIHAGINLHHARTAVALCNTVTSAQVGSLCGENLRANGLLDVKYKGLRRVANQIRKNENPSCCGHDTRPLL